MQKFLQDHPNYGTILAASFLMATCAAIKIFDGNPERIETLWMRCAYVGALTLISADTLSGTYLAMLRETDNRRRHRWIHGFCIGYVYALGVLIMLWEGSDTARVNFIIWGLSGGGFGWFMTWIMLRRQNDPKWKDAFQALSARYESQSIYARYPNRAWIFWGWPVLLLANFLFYGLFVIDSAETMRQPFFQMVVLSAIGAPYQRTGVKNFLDVLRSNPPFFLGLLLLFAGFFWA